MSKSELPPQALLREVGRRWPEAWRQYKRFRDGKGQPDFVNWPDWCYVPMAAAYAVVTGGEPQPGISQAALISEWVPAVAAAAAWRLSKGIYRFDADVYRELVEQPLAGKLPTAAFYSLPEWCVYIETPGVESHGFFVHLEHDANTGVPELRLLILYPDGRRTAIPVMLGDWDLRTAVDKLIASSQAQETKLFGAPVAHPTAKMREQLGEYVIPYLQLVLYLCSNNREMVPTRRRSRGRPSHLDVPREILEWDVGVRVGTSIRTYRNQQVIAKADPESTDAAPTEGEGRRHRSPRPHMRRAHWHSFWAGPRDGARKLVLHWLPPIPVNLLETEHLPAVVHRVLEIE